MSLKVRVTTVIDPAVARELDVLCVARHVAKSRVIAEAIREYLARRPTPDAPLAASLPRREGRPTREEAAARSKREEALRKTSGRPLNASRTQSGRTIVNGAEAVRSDRAIA